MLYTRKFILLVLLIFPCLCFAQQKDFFQISVNDLMQVSAGSNVTTEKNKQPVSITSINRTQLQLSGARTLLEALMIFVPGFFLVEDQDDIIAGFRGLAADNNSKVMLLVNGEVMNTEFFWGPAAAILNSCNYEYIERIEVIRGPGSVTLGQGALLGVINIITQERLGRDGVKVKLSNTYGLNQFVQGTSDVVFSQNDLEGFVHVGLSSYNGQTYRNEGWAKQKLNEGFDGGTVFNMKHRLKRSDNFTTIGKVQYKDFDFQLIHANQLNDLYNFYRDREVFQQNLTSVAASYTLNFTDSFRLKVSSSYAQDNIALHSLTGSTMGGTREDRYGLKAIANLDHLFVNNKLAVGVEYRRYEMGKKNQLNNNFIANVVGSFDPSKANSDRTMGYRRNIGIASIFMEDFFLIRNNIDLFLALRFDKHPFWGNYLSSRIGTLIKVNDKVRMRLSYQSGFRGAVGLHYTGGYRQDGHLSAENFDQVSEANIPGQTDIQKTRPERMDNFELSTTYIIADGITLDFTSFYEVLYNIIDVGVMYTDPNDFTMVNIGSDVPGDWNGYWFFKNSVGDFSKVGFESILSYNKKAIRCDLSHSLVKVASVNSQQKQNVINNSSMYLSYYNKDVHFKAYPENVTRLNLMVLPTERLNFSLNTIYYSSWYSPSGTKATGGFILNVGGSYFLKENLQITLNCKNILNENALYPMNSNSGGPDVSPGAPALESTSYWLTLRWYTRDPESSR